MQKWIQSKSLLLAFFLLVAACSKGRQSLSGRGLLSNITGQDGEVKGNPTNGGPNADIENGDVVDGSGPLPIQGTNLADLESTRARCDHRGPINGDYYVQCIAVALDKGGSEYPVLGLAAGVSLSWKTPTPEGDSHVESTSCQVTKNTLRQDCTVRLNAETISQRLKVVLDITKVFPDKPMATRQEFDYVYLPFSIATIGLPRHLSFLAGNSVPSAGSGAGLNLSDVPSAKDISWNFSVPSHAKDEFMFDSVKAMCARNGLLFVATDHIIYMIKGERVFYYAGTTNVANDFEVSHINRVYLKDIKSLTCRADSIVVHDSYCRFLELRASGQVSVILDERDPGHYGNCAYASFVGSAVDAKNNIYFADREKIIRRPYGKLRAQEEVVGTLAEAAAESPRGPDVQKVFLDVGPDGAVRYIFLQDTLTGKVWRMNPQGAVEHFAFTLAASGNVFSEGMDARTYKLGPYAPAFSFGNIEGGGAISWAAPDYKVTTPIYKIDAEHRLLSRNNVSNTDPLKEFGGLFEITTVGNDGAFYVAIANETNGYMLGKISISGEGSVVAGNPHGGLLVADAGKDAARIKIGAPLGLAFSSQGDLVFADSYLLSVHKVNTKNENTVVVASSPAKFQFPSGAAVGPDGAIYVYDSGSTAFNMKRIDPVTGAVTLFAGSTNCPTWRYPTLPITGNIGDGGQAKNACILPVYDMSINWNYGLDSLSNHDHNAGMVFDQTGKLLVADYQNGRVRAINPQTGVISSLIGNRSVAVVGRQEHLSDVLDYPPSGSVSGTGGAGVHIGSPSSISVGADNSIFFSSRLMVYQLSPDRQFYKYWRSPPSPNFTSPNQVTSLAALPNGSLLLALDRKRLVITHPGDTTPGQSLEIDSVLFGDSLAKDCGAGPVKNSEKTRQITTDISSGLSRICSAYILGIAQSGTCANPDDEFSLAFSLAYSLTAGGGTIVKMNVKCSALKSSL